MAGEASSRRLVGGRSKLGCSLSVPLLSWARVGGVCTPGATATPGWFRGLSSHAQAQVATAPPAGSPGYRAVPLVTLTVPSIHPPWLVSAHHLLPARAPMHSLSKPPPARHLPPHHPTPGPPASMPTGSQKERLKSDIHGLPHFNPMEIPSTAPLCS